MDTGTEKTMRATSAFFFFFLNIVQKAPMYRKWSIDYVEEREKKKIFRK